MLKWYPIINSPHEQEIAIKYDGITILGLEIISNF